MAPSPTHPRESYTVGIICALDVEKAAVEGTLDEEHGRLEQMAGDENSYSFGRLHRHNVVVACLPAGVMGKASAATVAKDMMRSFPIKAGLMVGIGGGVWSAKNDVRLGDVVVSQPDGMHGGVVQWDFGKMEKEGKFRWTGTLNKPPRPLLNAVQTLKATHRRKASEVYLHFETMLSDNPLMAGDYGCPGRDTDGLYETSYAHPGGDTCEHCDRARLVRSRPQRKDERPRIHYGNIASGDKVVKDGPTRDRIAAEEGILCFEMEAAGLMDTFPCVVIRRICDYADSHKNKRWQPYAAATAACYCKELLGVVDAQGVEQLGLANCNIPFSLKGVPVTDCFVQRPSDMATLRDFFNTPNEQARQNVFVVQGVGGIGKTQLCVEYTRQRKDDFSAIFWLNGSSKDALRQSLSSAVTRLPSRHANTQTLSQAGAQDMDANINRIRHWLSIKENTMWLLVFDNVDRDWQAGPGQEDTQAYDP
ncbi:hypothetical protein LTR53_012311 [Teratosphaeriaceae sp. CCFEE 6253]|nr:hypothetical protein LTR53_012311 [Teratosphaeriaceae sp. CCFEE 6253]